MVLGWRTEPPLRCPVPCSQRTCQKGGSVPVPRAIWHLWGLAVMQYNYFFLFFIFLHSIPPTGIPICFTKGVIHRLDKSKVRANFVTWREDVERASPPTDPPQARSRKEQGDQRIKSEGDRGGASHVPERRAIPAVGEQ